MAKSTNTNAASINAAQITADLFAQVGQKSEPGVGIVRGLFRITGNLTRDSGSLFAEISQGARASKVAYAVASQEAEAHHRKVIEARLEKLLAQ
jgi:hypothetical protein